ncbi:uncharacterized protein [Euphorbia lathyris]|uniref:uncharacterized protein n=1 Tax=Euphorbia lathyris TaxID=212925 RepID=UPI003313EE02
METNKYSSPSPSPQFFTASKQTPRTPCSSSVRPYHIRPLLSFLGKQKTANVSRFQAFELEQSQSSRKAEIEKERSINPLAKSLTTWLNFLFQNPKSSGCQLTVDGDQEASFAGKLGKMDVGVPGRVVDVEAAWRSRMRQSDHVELNKGEEGFLSSKNYGPLRNSLKDVCGFDDLKQRMRVHLSKEIFDVMTPVVKVEEIQRHRSEDCESALADKTNAAVEIQRFVRGRIARKRLLGASHCNFQTSVGCNQSSELKTLLSSILKLQRWWRGVLLQKLRTKSATTIQSYIRGWIGQRRASNKRHYVVIIQAHWKGYIARKGLRGQLLDLSLRVQRSAKNVDDGMRIINRLKMAVSELLTMKSISGILHTCATLDMTTKHSQKCCEELVASGAITILLKLIRSVSRSIPDQEVLKHALSTIRNLTRHQHLTEVLIDCHGSIELIFLEFLRNKEEGYFTASEILKKICSNQKGAESLWKVPGLVKRLLNLVEELTRKATIEKRNIQGVAAREKIERRLGESTELLITTDHFNLFGIRYRNSLKIFREVLI